MEKMTIQNPKVVELSFRVLEKMIIESKFNTKEELVSVANEMKNYAYAGNYPEELKLAYEEAINKINGLSLEQLKELRDIIAD